jgi:hypothetical protein
MHGVKQIAKKLVHAHVSGDKLAAQEAHLAMLSKVKAEADQLNQARVNDNV